MIKVESTIQNEIIENFYDLIKNRKEAEITRLATEIILKHTMSGKAGKAGNKTYYISIFYNAHLNKLDYIYNYGEDSLTYAVYKKGSLMFLDNITYVDDWSIKSNENSINNANPMISVEKLKKTIMERLKDSFMKDVMNNTINKFISGETNESEVISGVIPVEFLTSIDNNDLFFLKSVSKYSVKASLDHISTNLNVVHKVTDLYLNFDMIWEFLNKDRLSDNTDVFLLNYNTDMNVFYDSKKGEEFKKIIDLILIKIKMITEYHIDSKINVNSLNRLFELFNKAQPSSEDRFKNFVKLNQ